MTQVFLAAFGISKAIDEALVAQDVDTYTVNRILASSDMVELITTAEERYRGLVAELVQSLARAAMPSNGLSSQVRIELRTCERVADRLVKALSL